MDNFFKINKKTQNIKQSEKAEKDNKTQGEINDESKFNKIQERNETIPLRIEFIKNLMKDKEVEPILNFDSTETENFLGSRHDCNESGDSYDTRIVLKKRTYDFKNIISQFGGNLTYIKSGTTGHAFKGTINDSDGEFNFAVKIVAYPKKERYGSIYDTRRPENAELMMLKLLSYFVVNKQTPHLVLPIATFHTDMPMFIRLLKSEIIDNPNYNDRKKEDRIKKTKEFIERYENNEFSSTISILICEFANRGDLLDYLRVNYKKLTLIHWKVIFFQILATIAIIQYKYPSFRHNDLKANNILIHKIKRDKQSYSYVVVKKKYKVPNIGYQIKIWDFDFACIPDVIDNIKVQSKWTRKINITPEQNRYYDIHYFFNTLIKDAFLPQIMSDQCVPQEVRNFIDSILPFDLREESKLVSDKGRILTNKEYYTAENIISTNPFFEEFRAFDKKIENKKSVISIYDLDKILSGNKRDLIDTHLDTNLDTNLDDTRRNTRERNEKKYRTDSKRTKRIRQLEEDICT